LAYSKTKTAKIYLFQANSDSTVAQSETELCRVIKIAIAIEGEISSLLRRSELIKGASPRFQAGKDTGCHIRGSRRHKKAECSEANSDVEEAENDSEEPPVKKKKWKVFEGAHPRGRKVEDLPFSRKCAW
jgi:hypothetical protein